MKCCLVRSVLACQLCNREVEKLYKHHLVPKQRGGRKGFFILVCATCKDMIHQLYTNKELDKKYNTLAKLKNSSKVQKYIKWVKTKKRERFTIARKKKRS